jgi:hypothetical protein
MMGRLYHQDYCQTHHSHQCFHIFLKVRQLTDRLLDLAPLCLHQGQSHAGFQPQYNHHQVQHCQRHRDCHKPALSRLYSDLGLSACHQALYLSTCQVLETVLRQNQQHHLRIRHHNCTPYVVSDLLKKYILASSCNPTSTGYRVIHSAHLLAVCKYRL